MKVKYLSINLLLVTSLCLTLNHELFPAEKGVDPISNSFIINNLQMESDVTPSIKEQEYGEGEIIFDNSFDDSFSKKLNPESRGIPKNRLKKLLKSDKRLHLVEYKVKLNENLWKISKKLNISVNLLIEINNLKNPEHLKIHDVILIPSKKGIFYKIKNGDTLTEISRKFNIEIDLIAEHNNIDSRKIIAGKKIFIPDAEEPVKAIHDKIKKNSPDIEHSGKIAVIDNKIDKCKNKEKNTEKEKITAGKVVLTWPLRGPITSGFGIRTHPFSGDKKFHCGLDIGAEVGTVVKAAGEGTVIFSGWKDTYGNMIVISHKNNYISIYAHNSRLLVDVNEKIKKGQKIALSGKTGAVTGAHLHFEIRKGIVPLNPSRILK